MTPDEQTAYEAGCAEIDAKQTLSGRLHELKAVRDRADALEAQHTVAVIKYNALRAEIAALVMRLGASIRQLLGVSGKALMSRLAVLVLTSSMLVGCRRNQPHTLSAATQLKPGFSGWVTANGACSIRNYNDTAGSVLINTYSCGYDISGTDKESTSFSEYPKMPKPMENDWTLVPMCQNRVRQNPMHELV